MLFIIHLAAIGGYQQGLPIGPQRKLAERSQSLHLLGPRKISIVHRGIQRGLELLSTKQDLAGMWGTADVHVINYSFLMNF